ncbi:MAG: hypothetical protein COA86_04105 [Kangiella sp.]|nr:MAG: hypothetical protein COA86_18975 [Kangiella sp.]PHS19472.1 MAG: hypothetical protein COA86_04105 [Kangiella sp.]
MKLPRLFLFYFFTFSVLFPPIVSAEEFDESENIIDIFGFVAVSQSNTNAQSSWLNGGFGRFDGGASSLNNSSFTQLEVQLALEWSISDSAFIVIHTRANNESSRENSNENPNHSTQSFGLVEGYIDYSIYTDETSDYSLQLGQTFLTSSQENTNPLWQSPYTINFSTWNSWIAHEFRPIGLNFNYQFETFEGDSISFGIGAFIGNDSLGSQLVWGGWRVSHRLSVSNEVLPLGPLFTLEDGAQFSDQRDDGSKTFSNDLDDRFGFHALVKWQVSDLFNVKLSYVDNNGDRKLWRGEYAWDTSFVNLGSKWQINQNWEILGEWSYGKTGMGELPISVDVDFENTYFIASWHQASTRLSLRIESFSLAEKDFSLAENNDEKGQAWTVSWIYQQQSPWRFAMEYTALKTENTAQSQSGFNAKNNDKLFSLEIRREFN